MKFLTILILAVSVAMAQQPKEPTYWASDSLVRPANATQYTANDVVNDSLSSANKILAFKYAAKTAKGSGVIVAALLEIDTANVTNGNYRLLLFSDSVGSAADNAAWVPSHANNDRFIGAIDFALEINQSAGAGAAMGMNTGLVSPFVSGGRQAYGYIYGVLLAKGAHTPKFNGKYRVKLGILRD